MFWFVGFGLLIAAAACCCYAGCVHFYSTSVVQSGEGFPPDITYGGGTWYRDGGSVRTDSASGSLTYSPSTPPPSKFGIYPTMEISSTTGTLTFQYGLLTITTTFYTPNLIVPTTNPAFSYPAYSIITLDGVNQFPYEDSRGIPGVVNGIEVNEETLEVRLYNGSAITASDSAFILRVLNKGGDLSGEFTISFDGINKPTGYAYKFGVFFNVMGDNNGEDNQCPICYFNNTMICLGVDRPSTFEAYIGDAFGEGPPPAGTTPSENSASLNDQTLVFVKGSDQEFCTPDVGLNSGEIYTGPEFTVYKNISFLIPFSEEIPEGDPRLLYSLESSGTVRTYAVLSRDIGARVNGFQQVPGTYPGDRSLGFGNYQRFYWTNRCSQVVGGDGPQYVALFFVWEGDAEYKDSTGATIESVTGYKLCTQIKAIWPNTLAGVNGSPCSGSYFNEVTFSPYSGLPNPLIVNSRCWPTPADWSPPHGVGPAPYLKLDSPDYDANTFDVSVIFP